MRRVTQVHPTETSTQVSVAGTAKSTSPPRMVVASQESHEHVPRFAHVPELWVIRLPVQNHFSSTNPVQWTQQLNNVVTRLWFICQPRSSPVLWKGKWWRSTWSDRFCNIPDSFPIPCPSNTKNTRPCTSLPDGGRLEMTWQFWSIKLSSWAI